jgi:hypothetical protein
VRIGDEREREKGRSSKRRVKSDEGERKIFGKVRETTV